MRATLLAFSILLKLSSSRIYKSNHFEENGDFDRKKLNKSWFEKMSLEFLQVESNKEEDLVKSKFDAISRLQDFGEHSLKDELRNVHMQENDGDHDDLLMILEKSNEAFRTAAVNNLESILANDMEEVTMSNMRGNRRNTQIFNSSATNTSIYTPLRIQYITNDLENLLEENSPTSLRGRRINFLLEKVLPEAQRFLYKLLKVKELTEPIYVPSDVCLDVTSEVPEIIARKGVIHSQLVLFVRGLQCSGHIAGASPCMLSQHDYRPVIGVIYFCVDHPTFSPENNMGDLISSVAVTSTIHEITHILGMHSDVMPFYMDRSTGKPYLDDITSPVSEKVVCVDGVTRSVLKPSEKVLQRIETNSGNSYFEVVTPTVTTVVRNQFNCQSMNGARLENQPTSPTECFGSHWDERLFLSETMSAIAEFQGESSFSSLTLALLEDTGWYIGNYSMTQKSTFGHAAGCDFVNKDCIVNGGDIPLHSKGFFCNTPSSFYRNNLQYYCTPNHRSIGYCDLFDVYEEVLGMKYLAPPEFSYFNNSLLASVLFPKTDFCPISVEVNNLNCLVDDFGYPIENGLCVHVEVESAEYSFAQCTQYICNESLQKLQIIAPFTDIKLICDYDFQEIYHPEYYTVKLECPRLSVMCPDFFCPGNCEGKGICDYSVTPAQCKCFDENNNSTTCRES